MIKLAVLFLQTCLLVTHGMNFLPQMDLIVVIKDGSISETGSYDNLLEHNGAFSEFLKKYAKGIIIMIVIIVNICNSRFASQ